MNNEILELENILNQELEAYSKLEEFINGKKTSLIKGEIDNVAAADEELSKYNEIAIKLERKRKALYPQNMTLKQIIERIENREQANKISQLREEIRTVLVNSQKQNNINKELLKHSMKMVENSITTIANVLVPEGAAYNQKGALKSTKRLSNLSSIEHEA